MALINQNSSSSSSSSSGGSRGGGIDLEQAVGVGYDAADAVMRKLAGASQAVLKVRARVRLREAVRVTGGSSADVRRVDEKNVVIAATPATDEPDELTRAKARGVAAQRRLVAARFLAMRAAVAPFAVADGASVAHGYVVSPGGVGMTGRTVRAIDERDRPLAEAKTDARGYFRLGLDGAQKAGRTDGTLEQLVPGGLVMSQAVKDAVLERAAGAPAAAPAPAPAPETKAAEQAATPPQYAVIDTLAPDATAGSSSTATPALGAALRLVVVDAEGKEVLRDPHAYQIRLGHAHYRELIPGG